MDGRRAEALTANIMDITPAASLREQAAGDFVDSEARGKLVRRVSGKAPRWH